MVISSSLVTVLAKRVLEEVRPFTFAWLQIGIGVAVLTAFMVGVRGVRIPRGLPPRVWIYLVLIGVGNFAVVRVTFMLSLERIPAVTHAYLVNFVGIVTMLMSMWMLRERPGPRQMVGAGLAVVALHVFFLEIPAPERLTGVMYAAVGVVALALTNNLARQLVMITEGELSNDVISTLAAWIGGIPIVIAGLMIDGWPSLARADSWWVIGLAGVVTIAVGLTVWNHVLRTLRSFEASLLGSLSVVFAALFAIPILGEGLEPHEGAGIAMMMVAVVLTQLRGRA